MATVKIEESDGAQTVRLPEEYRLEAEEVRIRREGAGLRLEPVRNEDEDRLREWLALVRRNGGLDEDFVDAVLNERPGPEAYERPDIDLDP